MDKSSLLPSKFQSPLIDRRLMFLTAQRALLCSATPQGPICPQSTFPRGEAHCPWTNRLNRCRSESVTPYAASQMYGICLTTNTSPITRPLPNLCISRRKGTVTATESKPSSLSSGCDSPSPPTKYHEWLIKLTSTSIQTRAMK